MNDKNIDFYNNLSVDHFKKLSVMGGFDTYADMKLAYPYIKNAKSIIELGAGYGRCIEFYFQNNFQGKIIAVELVPKLAEYLREKYSGKIEVLQEDIKKLNLKERVDVALWMWSGFIDFSKEEQLKTIQRLEGLLSEKGKLVIDVPRIGFKTIASHRDEQNVFLESSYGDLHCFIPAEKDIQEYMQKSNFENVISLNYKTTTDKERTLFIIEK